MKIMHIGPDISLEEKYPLLDGFRELDIDIDTCKLVDEITDEDKVKRLNEHIDGFGPDIILSAGGWFGHYNSEEIFSNIRKKGIPHVYWATEDSTFFDWSSIVMIEYYDFIFTPSKICIPKYRELGKRAVFMPFSCIRKIYKPGIFDEKFAHDIIVLNNHYNDLDESKVKYRNDNIEFLIKPLIKEKYDIKLFGNGWDDKELDIDPEYIEPFSWPVQNAYKSAKIVLNLQWNYEGHIPQRTFEALGCGAFLLSAYTPLQEEFFKHTEHLVYSENAEDTLKYASYYLDNEKERREIALKGQIEVYKNHNSIKRASEAIEDMRKFNILKKS